MDNRFLRHKYALYRFFRSRGYEINTIKKTINIDVYNLNRKEEQRLKRLKAWGFIVVNPIKSSVRNYNDRPDYIIIDDNYNEQSFVDFADEVLRNFKYGLNDY